MRSRLIASLKKVNRFILTIPNGHHVTNIAPELINMEGRDSIYSGKQQKGKYLDLSYIFYWKEEN
ncbi:MAG: hypothetical protein AB8Z31_03310 [Coxiella endosymbiont of Haemaphysalis qinghaiensis]